MKQQQLTLITELQEINRAAADYMFMDNIVLIFVYKNYTSWIQKAVSQVLISPLWLRFLLSSSDQKSQQAAGLPFKITFHGR